MAFSAPAYGASRKYTDETVLGGGALKGKNCTIERIEEIGGGRKVTFKWELDDGTVKRSELYIYDGTPIYEWVSGKPYDYGTLVIYASCFYRCITPNSDIEFDDTKWNEIGSPDGNYDIVLSVDLLPMRFTSADRKMYYVIEERCFYLWNGVEWQEQAPKSITKAQIDALFE